uniref:Retrotransposon gag domain-containing protein n=1 Tax=Ananas comosus var. bracteatus TaxID=296719 RepID=A0A6V7P174_ANACO|nr:unnamed protein product [Ananas comosus var. bracteatus]
MAGTSSSSPGLASMISHPVQEKLAKNNHATWKAQVLATIRGARLEGYLTGKAVKPPVQIDGKDGDKIIKVDNPLYEDWLAADQQVLSYLLASVSKEVLAQVAAKQSAAEVWTAIEVMFASKTRARAVNTRLALATAQKGNMTVTEYVGKMRALGDEMAAAGRPLEDDELVEYILTGLDEEYDPVVSSVIGRSDAISVSELYSQMLAFETRLSLRNSGGHSSGSSANVANQRGRGGFGRSGRGGRGGRFNNAPANRGGRGPNPNNPHQGGNGAHNSNNSSDDRPRCQVCRKFGHTADRCWHRYDENLFQIKEMLVLLPQDPMVSTQTGTLIPAPPTTSLEGAQATEDLVSPTEAALPTESSPGSPPRTAAGSPIQDLGASAPPPHDGDTCPAAVAPVPAEGGTDAAAANPAPSIITPGSSASPPLSVEPAPVFTEAVQQETQPRPRTRLQAGVRKPKVYRDGTIRYGLFTATGEPQSLEEALGNKNWKSAMDDEYNALMQNKTWHLVPPQKESNSSPSPMVSEPSQQSKLEPVRCRPSPMALIRPRPGPSS